MKKFSLFLLFFIFLASLSWGTDYIWTGNAGDNNWTTSISNNTGTGNWVQGNYPGFDHFNDYPHDSAIFPINATVNLTDDPANLSSTQLYDHGLLNLEINSGVTLTIITNGRDLKVNRLVLNGTLILSGTGSLIIRDVTNTEGGLNQTFIAGLTVGTAGALQGSVSMKNANVVVTTGDVIITAASGDLIYGADNDGLAGIFFNPDNFDINASKRTVLRSDAGRVYIIGVAASHNKNMLFEANQYVEIRRVYSSTGSLIVNSPVRFGTANINITAAGIVLGSITGNGDLTLAGGSGTVTLNGGSGIGALNVSTNAVFQGAALSAASVSVTGTSAINVDITTTGTQTYTGAVTLGGAANALRTLTGTTVTLGAITGANHPLTITGSGVFNNGGTGIGALNVSVNATFQGAALNAASVSVTGTSTINVNITTTGGTQTYTGAVTLGGAAGATRTLLGTTVTLGMITGANHPLTITGSGVFNGGSGMQALTVSQTATFQTASLSAVSVAVTGTSAINVDITTTGAQTYTGAVTLGGAAAGDLRTLTGTTVNMGAITGAGHPLTITGNGVFNNGGSGITALNVSVNATFQGAALSAASVSVTGTSAINVDITTTGGTQTYTGNVTLGGAANALRTLTGTTVTLGTITGVNHPLTITGSGVFNGGTGIGALIVSVNATFSAGTLSAASVTVTGTSLIEGNVTTTGGTQNYNSAVTLGGDTGTPRNLTGATVTLETITGNNRALTVTGSGVFNGGTGVGALSVSQAATFQTANLNAASVSVTGTSAINVDITTTGGTQTYTGNVTLGGAANALRTLAGTTVTLGAVIGANHPLTITGSGVFNNGGTGIGALNVSVNATFQGAALSAASVAVTGTSAINVNITTTGGNQTYTGAVTLGGAANSLRTLTGANFQTTGAVTGNVRLLMNATADISIGTGGINLGANTLELDSTGGNITINGSINASSLKIKATDNTNGIVTIGSGAANITTTNTAVTPAECPHSVTGISIYIKAKNFVTTGFTGVITPGTSGMLCLDVESYTMIPVNRVAGDRYHTHALVPQNNTNLIYGTSIPTDLINTAYPYTFINSASNTGNNFSVSGTYNIYINEVGAQTLAVTFGITGTGRIEIRGVYNSSALTLTHSGTSGGVNLRDARINITGAGGFSTGAAATLNVTLNGTSGSEITVTNAGANITVGTITATGNYLTLNGNSTLNGGTGVGAVEVNGNATFQTANLSAASVRVTGTSAINVDITTTGGTQTYTGAVSLGGTANATRALTGSTVTLGPITGGSHPLTITGIGVLNGGTGIGALSVSSNATFQTADLNAASVSVNGTSAINVDITTTGIQTYTGAVTLGGGAGTTRALQGTTVTLGQITGNSHPLAITGNGVFNGGTGIGALSVSINATFQTNNLTAASVSVTGTSVINVNITTTGGTQTYTGAVTLGGAGGSTRILLGSTVTLGQITGAGHPLTITGNGVFNGGTDVGAITVSLTAIFQTASLSAASVSVTGTSAINVNITTTGGNQTYTGAVTLGGTAPGDLRTLTGTTVTLGQITGNSHPLTITGSGVFNGGTGIGALNVSVNATFQTVNLSAASVSVTGTSLINVDITTIGGNQTYSGAVTLGGSSGATRTLEGATVTLGPIAGASHPLTITGNGVFNGGSAIGALNVSVNATFQGTALSAASVAVTGTSAINVDITTTGTQTYTGNVTLGGTGVSTRTLEGTTVTLGSITGANHPLTITGNGVFNGGSGIGALNVSQTAAFNTANLSAASVSVTGTSAINVDITTTGGTQTYTGAVTLGGAAPGDLRTLTGTTVTLGSIAGANHPLTITGSGVFNGGSGIDALIVSVNATFQTGNLSAASVAVNGTSAINVNITTTGTQTYTGAVALGGTATRTLQGTIVTLGIITGNNHPLTITGNGVFNGGTDIGALNVSQTAVFQGAALGAASVTVTGTSAINVDITTTGTQTYTGNVTLGGAGVSTRILEGTTVTLGLIAGNNHPLTITGSGVFNGGTGIGALIVSVNAVFQNVNLSAASVAVTGTSAISVDITTAGTQTYTGTVTLGGTTNTLRTLTGSTVSLGLINGSNHPLTITGNGVFHGGSGIGALNVSQTASFQTADLSAVSVSVTGTSAISVNITTSGSQLYTGAINLSNSVSFKSINEHITINGGISGVRFDVIAESDSGVVTLNGTIIMSSAGTEGLGAAAIYIDAYEFAGSAVINLTGSGEVCAYIDEFTFTGAIHDKIHFHMRHIREYLVYSDIDPTNIDGIINYLWIQANRPSIGTNPVFHVPGNKKIYIMGVHNSAVNPVFYNDDQNDIGFIEFRGVYESSGSITLYPGTGGIRLYNADITLTGKPFAVANANNNVTLTIGNSSIKAASITVNNITGQNITGQNDNNLELTTELAGNILITGSIQSTGNLTMNNSAHIEITGNVGTSSVRIGGISVASNGGTAAFNGSIYAESYSQTGTGSADFAAQQNYSDNFSFTGNALTVHGNMNVGGTTAINNTGLFTLEAPLVSSGSVIKSAGGSSRVGANISTTGNAPPMPGTSIEFNNTFTLTRNVSLSANNGNINLDVVTSVSAYAFTMNSGTANITVTSDIGTLSDRLGNITINGNNITARDIYSGNNITITGSVISLTMINTAGSTVITNSGVFTAASVIISDNGFIQQTGSTGTSVLGGNVTTRGNNIVFINQITMNNDIEFSTVAAADGNISLAGIENNVPAAKNLTFTAGRGSIDVTGAIGSANPLGNIIVVSAQNAAFTGAVTAKSFTQNEGSGTTAFNGAQNYSAGFNFTGVNLTVNNALITDTDITNDDGAITVTNSGIFTIGAAPGRIAPNGESGKITVMGNTVNNGIIALAPVNLSQIAVDFYGNYTASANGELTGNPVTDPEIQFRRNAVIGTHTHNNNRVIFAHSAAPHELSVVSSVIPVFADVIIEQDNKVTVLALSGFKQEDGKTLTLKNNAVLDVSEGAWHIGKAGTLSKDFAGFNGDLILGTGAEIYVNNLNLTGEASPSASFSITNTLNSIIFIKGNVDISSNVTLDKGTMVNYPLLRLEMHGNGQQNLITDKVLGSLHVKINSQTILSTRNADETIYFRGEVKIFAIAPPFGLDAGSFNLVMYSGLKGYRNLSEYMHGNSNNDEIYFARWEVTDAELSAPPPFAVTPKIENFVFRQNYGQKISFRRDPDDSSSTPVFFEIVGNTMWQEFECLEGGAFVQFSRHPHQHTVLDNFRITGTEDNYVTLTRLTDNNFAYPYQYDPSYMGIPPNTVGVNGPYALPAFFPPMNLKGAGSPELQKYWNINLVSSPNPDFRPLAGFTCVRIFFSHAYNQRIPIEAKRMNLDVIPYWRDNNPNLDIPVFREGYFNFDWVELRKILYSFTEDANGNGRLDRIRVQTNISLNGDFSKFDAVVDGYKIDSAKFSRGYQMVNDFTGTGVFDDDSFFIYLIEDPDIDSGNTPLWHVINNGSLQDSLTGTPVGDPEVDVNIKPFDTIPPRIAHSLTLANHPQTYVRMSEPVYAEQISGISLNDVNEIETTPPYTFTWYYYPFEHNQMPVTKEIPVAEANLGYLLNWSNPFSADTLTKLKNIYTDTTSALEEGYFQIDNVLDQGQRAMDWSDFMLDEAFFIFYQPPKYPLNWGYTRYAKVMGNGHLKSQGLKDDESEAAIITDAGPGTIPIADVFLPPNKMLTVEMMQIIADGNGEQITPSSFASYNNADDIIIRRITDSLISIPPGSVNSAGFFAWPVWAKHQEALNKDPFNDNDIFWGQQQTDTGIIWEFDGTKYLEAFYLIERGDIIMQTRMNSSLANANLELFWSTNIPEKLRFPKEAPLRGRSSGGLWLPGVAALQPNEKLLYYFAPVYNGDDITSQNPENVSPPLYTYNFGKIISGSRVDFVYRMNTSDMYIARLDAPIDTIPDNWYKLVRPFSFDIQDIRRQRGGVTILNNVINPGNQESTYIRYHLVRPGRVTIQIYTLDGTLVKSIRRNENRAEGEYTDPWDGTNNSGRPVARGMYFVRVVAPDIDEIRKIMVVR